MAPSLLVYPLTWYNCVTKGGTFISFTNVIFFLKTYDEIAKNLLSSFKHLSEQAAEATLFYTI